MLGLTIDDLPSVKEAVLTGWERGLREGEQRGLQVGRAEGLLEGEARVLERLLTRRFGPLPDWVHARLRTADLESLERYAEAVLTAERLEAVFGP